MRGAALRPKPRRLAPGVVRAFGATPALFTTLLSLGCLALYSTVFTLLPGSDPSYPQILGPSITHKLVLDDELAEAGVEEWATYGPVSHNFSGRSLNAGASALKYCERHFGDAWLEHWLHRAFHLCSAQSSMRCRSIRDKLIPSASRPQMMCDATNLFLVPSNFTRAACPEHRPGYMCQGHTYNRYRPGSFQLQCNWPEVDMDSFPRDHLRDIFAAVRPLSHSHPVQPVRHVPTPVLLITREVKEYGNVFHTLTDLLNTYFTIRGLGWHDSHRRVVMLDNHPPGPLDGLWSGLAAGGGKGAMADPWGARDRTGQLLVQRASELPDATLLGHAAFVPPGYGSLLYAHLYEDNSCPFAFPTSLLKAFRSWALEGLGLPTQVPVADRSKPLQVVLVSRQSSGGRGGKRVTRRIGNEPQLLGMLAAIPGCRARLVDLAALPLRDQIELLASTDVLVGMHGAAMAWTLLMGPHAAAVELWPQEEGVWRCYEHFAQWAGLLYRRWAAPAVPGSMSSRTRAQAVTNVDVQAVRELVEPLVLEVAHRKVELVTHRL